MIGRGRLFATAILIRTDMLTMARLMVSLRKAGFTFGATAWSVAAGITVAGVVVVPFRRPVSKCFVFPGRGGNWNNDFGGPRRQLYLWSGYFSGGSLYCHGRGGGRLYSPGNWPGRSHSERDQRHSDVSDCSWLFRWIAFNSPILMGCRERSVGAVAVEPSMRDTVQTWAKECTSTPFKL